MKVLRKAPEARPIPASGEERRRRNLYQRRVKSAGGATYTSVGLRAPEARPIPASGEARRMAAPEPEGRRPDLSQCVRSATCIDRAAPSESPTPRRHSQGNALALASALAFPLRPSRNISALCGKRRCPCLSPHQPHSSHLYRTALLKPQQPHPSHLTNLSPLTSTEPHSSNPCNQTTYNHQKITSATLAQIPLSSPPQPPKSPNPA